MTSAPTPDKTAAILAALGRLEEEENIRVLYACESGSRAWGFASPNSDYDVRFIYVRPLDWYLSIFDRKDTIERPLDDELDLSGWDVRKALQLFRKSNPPLAEWLNSPIVYLDRGGLADELRRALWSHYSISAASYHYFHMARGNFRDYLQGDTVRLKKYLYVLRPLLAVLWLERRRQTPPVRFDELLDGLLPDGELRREIDEKLLAPKMAGDELAEGPALPLVDAFIRRELEWRESARNLVPDDRDCMWENGRTLDDLFRRMALGFPVYKPR